MCSGKRKKWVWGCSEKQVVFRANLTTFPAVRRHCVPSPFPPDLRAPGNSASPESPLQPRILSPVHHCQHSNSATYYPRDLPW